MSNTLIMCQHSMIYCVETPNLFLIHLLPSITKIIIVIKPIVIVNIIVVVVMFVFFLFLLLCMLHVTTSKFDQCATILNIAIQSQQSPIT